MGDVFVRLQKQFETSESYDGAHIRNVIKTVIKAVMLQDSADSRT